MQAQQIVMLSVLRFVILIVLENIDAWKKLKKDVVDAMNKNEDCRACQIKFTSSFKKNILMLAIRYFLGKITYIIDRRTTWIG